MKKAQDIQDITHSKLNINNNDDNNTSGNADSALLFNECPVLQCYCQGLQRIPNSKLLREAIKISFPWITDYDIIMLSSMTVTVTASTVTASSPAVIASGSDDNNTQASSFPIAASKPSSSITPFVSTSSSSVTRKKKGSKGSNHSLPTKAQRDSCEPVDVRGASGAHELRINGVYVPSDELMGELQCV